MNDNHHDDHPRYYGGPTRNPILTIGDITERDLEELIRRLNYVEGIVHSSEVIIGRWTDGADHTDTRQTGNFVMGEKLMMIITALGYANVGFITDKEDQTHPQFPMIAGCLADAVMGILDLAAANGWSLGDIIAERIKHHRSVVTNGTGHA